MKNIVLLFLLLVEVQPSIAQADSARFSVNAKISQTWLPYLPFEFRPEDRWNTQSSTIFSYSAHVGAGMRLKGPANEVFTGVGIYVHYMEFRNLQLYTPGQEGNYMAGYSYYGNSNQYSMHGDLYLLTGGLETYHDIGFGRRLSLRPGCAIEYMLMRKLNGNDEKYVYNPNSFPFVTEQYDMENYKKPQPLQFFIFIHAGYTFAGKFPLTIAFRSSLSLTSLMYDLKCQENGVEICIPVGRK